MENTEFDIREENLDEIQKVTWQRRADADSSIEVSTAGLSEYSALRAKFAPDTILGRFDISGMTVEAVYQDIIKRSGKGLPPARSSYLHREGMTRSDAEDFSYNEGYLPLWTLWAEQNPGKMDNLKEMLSDGVTVLTDRYASTEVSQARALADIINGDGHGFDESLTRDFFSRDIPKPEWDSRSLEHDVMTVGLGRRSTEEFLELIPPGTRKVIDTRNWTQNTRNPAFNRVALQKTLADRGIRYEWSPALSGKPKKGEEALYENGDTKRVDYTRYMDTDRAKAAYESLKRDIRSGGVTVISSEEKPMYSARALMLGQRLERDGFSVGHVEGAEDGLYRVSTQTDVALDALKGHYLADGRASDIEFFSDLSFKSTSKVDIRQRALPGDSEQERTVDKGANYGTPVSLVVHPGIEPKVRRRSSEEQRTEAHEQAMWNSARANAEWADYTIVLSKSAHEIKKFDLTAGNAIRINIPTGPQAVDQMRDTERTRRITDRVSDRIERALLARSWNDDSFSMDSVKINVVGSHIASLANQWVDEKVSEDEISGKTSKRLAQTGLSLEDRSGVTQEDINAFVKDVITCLCDSRSEGVAFDENDIQQRTWKVGEIRTNGESGVAEAATLASQELGLTTSVGTGESFRLTRDNETLKGAAVTDRTLFMNRWNLGLRREVTREDVQQNLDMAEFRRNSQNLNPVPGLSDRYILILQEIGFSNTDLVDIYELAKDNGITVNDDDDLIELVDDAAGYGIEGAGYISLPIVENAGRRVDAYLKEAKEMGYGVLTVASENYPRQLIDFKDYSVEKEQMKYEMTDEGASVRTVREPVQMRRPAVLWYQGADPGVAEGRGVTFIGESGPLSQTVAAAMSVGAQVAEADLTAIAALDGTAAQDAVFEAVRRKGTAVAVSPDPIDAEKNADTQKQIERCGGVTFSETGPKRNNKTLADGADQAETESRAKRISATLGKVTAVVDATLSARPVSAIEAAGWSLYGVFALAYAGIGKLTEGMEKDRFDKATEGNRKMEADGTPTVGITGEGFGRMAESVDRAMGGGPDESLDESRAQQAAKELHPSQMPVEVIHYGNRHVFLVSDRYPDIIETIRREYGQDAEIKSPSEKKDIIDALNHRETTLSGRRIRAFEGYTGTQVQEKECWTERMFYYRGRMESLLTVPGQALGLPSLQRRMEQFKLFGTIRQTAEELQTELNRAAGLDIGRAVHYEHALHPVINGNSVELRIGDEAVARVSLSSCGEIRIENCDTLSQSLGEHHVSRNAVFRVNGGPVDEETVHTLCEQMKEAVLGTVASEKWSVGTREEVAELKERISQGFDREDADNLDLATKDAGKAEFIAPSDWHSLPRETAYGHILALTAEKEEVASSLDSQLNTLSEELHSLKSKTAEDTTLTDEQKEAIGQEILQKADRFRALAEQKQFNLELIASLDDLRREVSTSSLVTARETRDYASLTKGVEDAISACRGKEGEALDNALKDLKEAKDRLHGETLEVSVDGRRVVLSGADGRFVPDPDKAREMCMKERESLAERPLVKTTQSVAVSGDRTVAEVRTKTTEVSRGQDRNVRGDDMILGESNGVSIISRNGMQAYADKSMTIFSDFYKELTPFCSTVGVATREDGKQNIITRDGAELSPVWYDKAYKVTEGTMMIKVDEMYNHLDLHLGKLVSEDWAPAARPFHEGWAAIMGGPSDGMENVGKFNYINREGDILSGKWFDSVQDFNNGKAQVVLDGMEALVDKNNVVEFLEVTEEVEESVGLKR